MGGGRVDGWWGGLVGGHVRPHAFVDGCYICEFKLKLVFVSFNKSF
jgi:hypothetical protein